jgi:hypothetical protein
VDSLELWEGKITENSNKQKSTGEKSNIKALEDQDKLGRKLSPQGAILRVNLNQDHWLNFGCGKMVPVYLIHPQY